MHVPSSCTRSTRCHFFNTRSSFAHFQTFPSIFQTAFSASTLQKFVQAHFIALYQINLTSYFWAERFLDQCSLFKRITPLNFVSAHILISAIPLQQSSLFSFNNQLVSFHFHVLTVAKLVTDHNILQPKSIIQSASFVFLRINTVHATFQIVPQTWVETVPKSSYIDTPSHHLPKLLLPLMNLSKKATLTIATYLPTHQRCAKSDYAQVTRSLIPLQKQLKPKLRLAALLHVFSNRYCLQARYLNC